MRRTAAEALRPRIPARLDASHCRSLSYPYGARMKSHELTVTVQPRYLAEQSDPAQRQYVFAYTIRITNTGSEPAQLISRHWIITDGNQQQQEVRGLGVVGQQPLLQPGESFEYTSGCPLSTPVGTMRGTYHCVGENGMPFEVEIPEFVLAMPRTLH